MTNKLPVEETNSSRAELEKEIRALLKKELALMKRKGDLFKECNKLIVKTTNAYLQRGLPVWLRALSLLTNT